MRDSGSPLSWEVRTPVLATFTKETFPTELEQNEDLMVALKKGALRELEEAGFTGNLAEIDSTTDYSKKSLQLIDHQLKGANFTDGESVYYTARALTAKGLLDPASRQQVIEFAKNRIWKIFASRDWHKKNSRHFSVNGGMWPVHGVENTWGARFHPDLILPEDAIIISKGMEIWEDAYSAFDGFAFMKFATEQVEYYVKMKLNNVLNDSYVHYTESDG